MDYEEMIKEAVRFGRLGVGRRIRRALGMKAPAQKISPIQSSEGRMFDKMMAEFVAANPRMAERAYKPGGEASISRAFKKHQKKFLGQHGLTEEMMKARLPTNEKLLAAQVKRHHRRQVMGRTPKPNVEQAGRPVARGAAYGTIGVAGGLGLGSALSSGQQQQQQPPAGYAGGGAYGY